MLGEVRLQRVGAPGLGATATEKDGLPTPGSEAVQNAQRGQVTPVCVGGRAPPPRGPWQCQLGPQRAPLGRGERQGRRWHPGRMRSRGTRRGTGPARQGQGPRRWGPSRGRLGGGKPRTRCGGQRWGQAYQGSPGRVGRCGPHGRWKGPVEPPAGRTNRRGWLPAPRPQSRL